jgi:hypothetical protein
MFFLAAYHHSASLLVWVEGATASQPNQRKDLNQICCEKGQVTSKCLIVSGD